MRKFRDLGLSVVALLVSYGVYKLSASIFSSLENDFLADFLMCSLRRSAVVIPF